MNGSAPSFSSNGAAHPSPVASVRLAELVPRPSLHIDRRALRDYLANRTVLVTGAAGSIGTELARQLVQLSPGALVLVDMSEHNLFRLEQVLAPAPHGVTLCLADVRDTEAMASLFVDHGPDVVLHAAAYKHVPLMERHPAAALHNNALATARLVDRSGCAGVEQFVFVSTDKAVAPAGVLGATKRLAEWYVRTAAAPPARKVVRFGNVFGSRGSVVPRFERQLARGKPLTVTHPKMERFFMSAREAGHLILQTLLLDAAPVYALEMGEPVRIRWLAEQMIRRCAPECDPDDRIVYTGRRAGEKLAEQLHTAEERRVPTGCANIIGLDSAHPLPHADVDTILRRLRALSRRDGPAALREALLDPVRLARSA